MQSYRKEHYIENREYDYIVLLNSCILQTYILLSSLGKNFEFI